MLNLLVLAYLNLTELAYAYYGEAGHTATIAGKVIHLISCMAVEVKSRASNRCYAELPVLKGNESYFMPLRTRILQKHGSEVNCNPILPSIFQVEGSWYAYVPYTSKEPDPIILDPNEPERLTLKTTYNLAKGGIYNREEIEKLNDHLLHPAKSAAISNVFIRDLSHQNPDLQGLSLKSLADSNFISHVKEKLQDAHMGQT